MRIIKIILCSIVALSFSFLRVSAIPEIDSVVIGSVFKTSDELFMFPYYENINTLFEELIGSNDSPGLKINFLCHPPSIKTGDELVCFGKVDRIRGCMDVTSFKSIKGEWIYGFIKNGEFYVGTRKVKLITGFDTLIFNKGKLVVSLPDGEADVLCSRLEKHGENDTFNAHLFFVNSQSRTSFTGVLVDKQEKKLISIEAKNNWGSYVERMKFYGTVNENAIIMEGPSQTTFEHLSTGKLGICIGYYNRVNQQMGIDVVNADIQSATYGGRILGIVSTNDEDSFRIKTVLPGCLTVNTLIKIDKDTTFLKDGVQSSFDYITKNITSSNIFVEVIGTFLDDQFTLDASLVRMNPKNPSHYFCGIIKGKEIKDFFGNKKTLKLAKNAKLLSGQRNLDDGTVAQFWFEGDESIAFNYPQVGPLGLGLSGYIIKIDSGKITLNCQRAYDYNLFGRQLNLAISSKCKFIKGGIGEINPNEISPNTRVICWGFIQEDVFQTVLVNY